jgi:hypothetical protein
MDSAIIIALCLGAAFFAYRLGYLDGREDGLRESLDNVRKGE